MFYKYHLMYHLVYSETHVGAKLDTINFESVLGYLKWGTQRGVLLQYSL